MQPKSGLHGMNTLSNTPMAHRLQIYGSHGEICSYWANFLQYINSITSVDKLPFEVENILRTRYSAKCRYYTRTRHGEIMFPTRELLAEFVLTWS